MSVASSQHPETSHKNEPYPGRFRNELLEGLHLLLSFTLTRAEMAADSRRVLAFQQIASHQSYLILTHGSID
jgi:hypothetical protein